MTEREDLEKAMAASDQQRTALGQRLRERGHLEKAEAILGEIGAGLDLAKAKELLRR